MILPPFELHQPRTLAEALGIARRNPDSFDYVAGGTDLLQNYKNRLNCRRNLISLSTLEEPGLRGISATRIGALATLSDIEAGAALPVLRETAAVVASPLIRQSATLGGNLLVETRCFYFNQSEFWRASKGGCLKEGHKGCLVVPQEETCYATCSGDMAAALLVLGASVHLEGLEGGRDVPLAHFFQPDGIRKNVAQRDEILTHVDIPPSSGRLEAGYRKLRVRDTFDYPLLGTAAALRIEGGCLAELRLCVNAVDTVPLVLDELAEPRLGRPFGTAEIDAVATECMARAMPVKNVGLQPHYRRAMVRVYMKRLLADLFGRVADLLGRAADPEVA